MRVERRTRYRLSERDHIAARVAWQNGAASRGKRVLLIFLILAALLSIQLWRERSLDDLPLLFICLLLVAGLALLVDWLAVRWLIPRSTRRYYRQTKCPDEEIELYWDDQAIHFRSGRGESHTPLGDWHAWLRTPDVLLLYENDALYYAVPARVLGEEALNDLTALLAAAGAKDKSQSAHSKPMSW